MIEVLQEYNQHEYSEGLLNALGVDASKIKKIGISDERIQKIIPVGRQ